jgi:hypothetical protein
LCALDRGGMTIIYLLIAFELASGVWLKFIFHATPLLVPFAIWMPPCSLDEQSLSGQPVVYLPGLLTHT